MLSFWDIVKKSHQKYWVFETWSANVLVFTWVIFWNRAPSQLECTNQYLTDWIDRLWDQPFETKYDSTYIYTYIYIYLAGVLPALGCRVLCSWPWGPSPPPPPLLFSAWGVLSCCLSWPGLFDFTGSFRLVVAFSCAACIRRLGPFCRANGTSVLTDRPGGAKTAPCLGEQKHRRKCYCLSCFSGLAVARG